MRILLSLLVALVASNHYNVVSAYHHWEESNYLANFNQLESKSYSIVNDPNIAPAALLDNCKVTDRSNLEQYHDGTTVTLVRGGKLASRKLAMNCCRFCSPFSVFFLLGMPSMATNIGIFVGRPSRNLEKERIVSLIMSMAG